MNTDTKLLETETKLLIDRSLKNLGWIIRRQRKNVFFSGDPV